MKAFTIFIFTVSAIFFLKLGNGYAGEAYPEKNKTILYINNQNNKDLGVLIKPKLIAPALLKKLPLKYRSQGEHIKNAGLVGMTIPACIVAEISFSKVQIGAANLFSVTGETNPITPTGKCSNLEFGKMYYVWFTNDNLGTTCVSQELEEPLIMAPFPQKISYKNVRLHIKTPDEMPDRSSQAFPLCHP